MLKSALRAARVRAYCHGWQGLNRLGLSNTVTPPVAYVIERAD